MVGAGVHDGVAAAVVRSDVLLLLFFFVFIFKHFTEIPPERLQSSEKKDEAVFFQKISNHPSNKPHRT